MSKISFPSLLIKGAILIITAINLSGCGTLDSVGLAPGPMFATNFPPDGPPNYQHGITDGCKTASGATGGAIMSLIYDQVYYDVNQAITDEVYHQAWKDGYAYCKFDLDSAPMS
jgi:hypothetical protein